MPINAISADGATHSFPDGTEPTVIDRVMKDYATQKAPASEPAPEKPHTTLGGMAGSATRGAAPMAVGAGLGAALGAPTGVGIPVGAAAGAGAMGVAELAVPLYNRVADKMGWPKSATPQEMTDKLLDLAGVARPSTGAERVTEAMTGGAASALGPAKLAGVIADKATRPVAKAIAERLAERPGLQMASGAVGGLTGQTAAEAGAGPIGQAAASLAGGALPYTPAGVRAASSIKSAEQYITDKYTRAVKPTIVGKGTTPQLDRYQEQARGAVDSIVVNKPNLKFTDDAGNVIAGELPKSLDQFGDAIDQTKGEIFKKYDAMAQQAGQAGVIVPMAPVVNELRTIQNNRTTQAFFPELAKYAEEKANSLTALGSLPAADAQDAIRMLNASLKGFYRNPDYTLVARNSIDSMIANKLREGLDIGVTSAAGPGYQELKNEYGGLRQIEGDVVKRLQIVARQEKGGGIMGRIGDIASAEQVLHGLISLSPATIARGVALKGFAETVKYLRSPNRAVRQMFEEAETPRAARTRMDLIPPLPLLMNPGMEGIVIPPGGQDIMRRAASGSP